MLRQRLGLCCLVGCMLLISDGAGTAQKKKKKKKKDQATILKVFVDEFVLLTPGKGKFPASFEMGSKASEAEQPAHKVKFSKPFYMAKYEVTQELYETVMGNNPSRWKGPRNSVEKMNWSEANEFCTKVTKLLQQRKLIQPNEVIRLPSEAEWEYACRAGTTTPYSFGADAAKLKDYAWFKGNSKGEDPPVGVKKPNPWGLYDMHGYIWEWTLDAWLPTYKGAPADGSARKGKNAKQRVIRGGAWTDQADRCRSAFRVGVAGGLRNDAVGFRCVRVANQSK